MIIWGLPTSWNFSQEDYDDNNCQNHHQQQYQQVLNNQITKTKFSSYIYFNKIGITKSENCEIKTLLTSLKLNTTSISTIL